MNRRGFIRKALAAVAGVTAGALMPKTSVEQVAKVLQYDPNSHGGPILYKTIQWIEDVDCPSDTIYLICRDDFYRQRNQAMLKL